MLTGDVYLLLSGYSVLSQKGVKEMVKIVSTELFVSKGFIGHLIHVPEYPDAWQGTNYERPWTRPEWFKKGEEVVEMKEEVVMRRQTPLDVILAQGEE